MIPIILLISLLVCSSTGSHFRYGSISWKTSDSSYNTIDFTLVCAFRTGYFTDPSTVTTGSTLYTYGGAGDICFGDPSYTCTNIPEIQVTSVNSQDGWIIGTYTTSFTYPQTTSTYQVYFQGYARISDLRNNADMSWYVHSDVLVDAQRTPLASPISQSLPILIVPANQNGVTYQVSTDYVLKRNLTYRLSTPIEMGDSYCTQPPGIQISPTGLISFPNGLDQGLWSSQVYAYDPVNGVGLGIDFIIYAAPIQHYCTGCPVPPPCNSAGQCDGSCSTSSVCAIPAPTFITNNLNSSATPRTNMPTLERNAELVLKVGQSVSIPFMVQDNLFGDADLYLYTTQLPNGASFSSLQSCQLDPTCVCQGCNKAAYAKFTWTPQASDAGQSASFCVGARSLGNDLSYGSHCLVIRVSACDATLDCSSHGQCAADGSLSCTCETGYVGAKCNRCDDGRLIYPTCYNSLPTGTNYVFNKAAFNNGQLRVLDSNGAQGRATLNGVSVASSPTNAFKFTGSSITGAGTSAGMCMDVWGSSYQPGTVVGIYGCNGQPNQKWQVSGTGDWKTISPLGKPTLCLAPTGGNTASGTAVIIQQCDGKDSQLWHITSTSPPAVPVTINIELGVTAANASTVDITALAASYALQYGVPVKYINITLINLPSGSTKRAVLTGKLVASFISNTPIVASDQISLIAEKATPIVPISDVSVQSVSVTRVAAIIPAAFNYIFNKEAFDSHVYNVFDSNPSYSSTCQPSAVNTTTRVWLFSGTSIKTSSGQCLDVFKSNIKAGTTVGTYKCLDQPNQKWIYGSTTEWAPISPASDKSLCLAPTAGQAKVKGASVKLVSCNGGSHQLWRRSTDAPAVV